MSPSKAAAFAQQLLNTMEHEMGLTEPEQLAVLEAAKGSVNGIIVMKSTVASLLHIHGGGNG